MNTGHERMDERSLERLAGVHPKLVRLIKDFAQISPMDFIVVEGLRTTERQRELVQAGASKTMASKHLVGRAVDLGVIVVGEYRGDWPLYTKLGKALKAHAKTMGIDIVWGGDWKSFKDGPHFELGVDE
jgi:peptidoglycan L-alanyl-D-glutamate endopeptidase CwlK